MFIPTYSQLTKWYNEENLTRFNYKNSEAGSYWIEPNLNSTGNDYYYIDTSGKLITKSCTDDKPKSGFIVAISIKI